MKDHALMREDALRTPERASGSLYCNPHKVGERAAVSLCLKHQFLYHQEMGQFYSSRRLKPSASNAMLVQGICKLVPGYSHAMQE